MGGLKRGRKPGIADHFLPIVVEKINVDKQPLSRVVTSLCASVTAIRSLLNRNDLEGRYLIVRKGTIDPVDFATLYREGKPSPKGEPSPEQSSQQTHSGGRGTKESAAVHRTKTRPRSGDGKKVGGQS